MRNEFSHTEEDGHKIVVITHPRAAEAEYAFRGAMRESFLAFDSLDKQRLNPAQDYRGKLTRAMMTIVFLELGAALKTLLETPTRRLRPLMKDVRKVLAVFLRSWVSPLNRAIETEAGEGDPLFSDSFKPLAQFFMLLEVVSDDNRPEAERAQAVAEVVELCAVLRADYPPRPEDYKRLASKVPTIPTEVEDESQAAA